jgi:ketosteroid isomerase-like protein
VSPEELGVVRDAYDAFARGDMEALTGRHLDPEIEWRTTTDVPFQGTYRGMDEFLRGMGEWTEAFDEMTTQVEELIDAGDRAVVLHRMRGRGRDSGVEVDLALWQVVSVRDGRVVTMHDYPSREEALAAARA